MNTKSTCDYIARNENLVRDHAKKGGFPTDRVSEVRNVNDPATAEPHARAWE